MRNLAEEYSELLRARQDGEDLRAAMASELGDYDVPQPAPAMQR